MDTFNFLVSILIMMIGIQMQATWIVFAVLAISILTSKDLSTIIAFIIATGVLYLVIAGGNIDSTWPIAIFGLVIVSIILGSKPKQDDGAGMGMDPFGGFGGGGY